MKFKIAQAYIRIVTEIHSSNYQIDLFIEIIWILKLTYLSIHINSIYKMIIEKCINYYPLMVFILDLSFLVNLGIIITQDLNSQIVA